jgi:hypothetical protein
MLDAEEAKQLYENLNVLANSPAYVDTMAACLMALTGIEADDHGTPVLDPSTRDSANRVAMQWLRDNEYIPRRGQIRREDRVTGESRYHS